MKKIIVLLLIAVFGVIFCSCSENRESDKNNYSGVDPKFSDNEKELGSLIGTSLRKTVYKLKEEKIDFSDNNKVQDVASAVITDEMIKRYPSVKNEILSSTKQFATYRKSNGASKVNKSTTFKSLSKSKDSGLSSAQKRVLEVIEQARVTSGSAISFMDKLAAINTRVDDFVPENEREVIHQIIAATYYKIKVCNNLVAAGQLPGVGEKRATPQNGLATKLNNLRLSDLITNANADPEYIIILNTVYVTAGSGGNGSAQEDWYRAQEEYVRRQTELMDQQENSWWESWGSCTAGIVSGAGIGFFTGATYGGVGCTFAVPVFGTVACGIVGGIVGIIVGGLGGAVAGC